MGASNWVHLDFELIVAETERALLVRLEEGDEVWIPKSVVADADDYEKDDGPGTVSVLEWFAKKENLT